MAGSGSAEALLSQVELGETEVLDFLPTSVSPDGRFLLFVGHHPKRALDVMLLPLDGGPPQPFVATEHSEVNGDFSPDGRWVVFLSDETGRHEVYVRPFPSGDAEWQISSGGGDDPRWSPDGSELFYRNGSDLMSVRYTSEGEFQPESPRLILTTDFYNVPGLSFDTSVDGERFLLNRPVNAGQAVRHIRLVSNWFDELERLVPTD